MMFWTWYHGRVLVLVLLLLLLLLVPSRRLKHEHQRYK